MLPQIAQCANRKLQTSYLLVSLLAIVLSLSLAALFLFFVPFASLRLLTLIGLVLFTLIIGRTILSWRRRDIFTAMQNALHTHALTLDDLYLYCQDNQRQVPLLARTLLRYSTPHSV